MDRETKRVFNVFGIKQRSLLGVDIGTSSVKMVLLSQVDGKRCLDAYACIPFADGVVEGGVIKELDAVAEIIHAFLVTLPVPIKQAAIAVSDASAISKVIQVSDSLNDMEIEELVLIEAEKYIPYPIEEINLDFSVIGPSLKNTAMLDVLLVASRSEYVTNRVEAVTRAGLRVAIVDVESYAIERIATQLIADLPLIDEKKIVAVIDMGATYTHLFILRDGKIIFSREEEFGGKQLIESLVEQYNLQPLDAALALETGQLPDGADKEVLQPFNELILLQVKRTLQFFFSTSHYTLVDYILLAGGVTKLSGIVNLLQEHVNIPTILANPFMHMDVGPAINRDTLLKEAPRLMAACGLAMRQIS